MRAIRWWSFMHEMVGFFVTGMMIVALKQVGKADCARERLKIKRHDSSQFECCLLCGEEKGSGGWLSLGNCLKVGRESGQLSRTEASVVAELLKDYKSGPITKPQAMPTLKI